MATYYCDPENHTGTASDAVGGGTTAGNAYVELDYAVNDINVTHGKVYSDTVKMIGTYAPSVVQMNALTGAIAVYGSYFRMMSDGATAFGTQSPTSMATMSGANSLGKITNSTGLNYLTVNGFNCTGFVNSTYLFDAGSGFIFQNNYCDMAGITTAAYVARGRAAWMACNNYVKATDVTGSGNIFGGYTYHRIVGNYIHLNNNSTTKGLTLSVSNANALNQFAYNMVLLEGTATAFNSNATGVQFIGNTIVGATKVGQSGLIGWSTYLTLTCTNNHFENLYQAFGGVVNNGAFSRGVVSTDNTYFNVDYVDTPNPDYTNKWDAASATIARNTNLGSSGVQNAATGDLRTARNRLGKSALNSMNLPMAWAQSLSNGAGIQSPTQYRPFG